MTSNIYPLLVLVLIPYLVDSQTLCSSGWFGKDCRHICHCTGQLCDNKGDCLSGSQCDSGWFGPSCQYVDLALSSLVIRATSQGTVNPVPSKSCYGGTGVASVTFTWSSTFHLNWMRLIFNDPGFMDKVNISLKISAVAVTCQSPSNSKFNEKILDIHCPQGVKINQVILTGEGIASLCSVYITDGRNIALKQTANMTSTYFPHSADKAVDGDFTGSITFCACSNFKDLNPSWFLIFSKPNKISRFELYNRDSEQYRLQNFDITSFTHENTNMSFIQIKSTIQLPLYTVMPDSVLQNVTIVQISSKTEYFTICEVIIYGDVNCPIGMFGADCEKTCNCAIKDEACFASTGGCPSGCLAGYYGDGCSVPCSAQTYGVDCKHSCSQNCQDKLCKSAGGECINCVPGKQGDFCDKACQPGYYGSGCKQVCSQFCADDLHKCHEVSGVCLNCEVGYIGGYCNETCQTNNYGVGCLNTCSSNCTNQTCNHISGNCFSCIPGMHGDFCELDQLGYLAMNEMDLNTSLITGPVVAVVVLTLIIVIVVLVWRRHRNSSKTAQSQGHKKKDNDHVPFTESQQMEADEQVIDETDSNKIDNVPYYNVSKLETSMAIKVKDLHAFLLTHNMEFFKKQFETIPNINPEATTNVAHRDKNKNKNRYKNICAYDHSRVCLSINKERNEEDYINASYIEGYKNKEMFIAAQGPNAIIIDDFVRMLWEQKIEKVVMLTHLVEEGKQKCDRYWPEDNKAVFGSIQIKLAATQKFADYTIRKMKLKKTGEPSQNITHFHFTSWPDKGVPTTPWGLVDFEQRVFACPTTKPVVVHCSAGIGRTGTFIALHNVIREAVETGHIDFYNTLVKLRKDRMNMIQTAVQYAFLHKAAEAALLCLKTTISGRDISGRIQTLEKRESDIANMEIEFNSICDVCTDDKQDVTENEFSGNRNTVYENSRTIANKLKNRFSNIISNDLHRPHLTDIGNQKAGDYINAVLVPSFSKLSHQILTQLPLPTTITDFWRLVTQYSVSLIVAFELNLKAVDSTIGNYLPSEENFISDLFTIQSEPAISEQYWLQQKLQITTNTKVKNVTSYKTEVQHVTHLTCTSTDLKPNTLLALVDKIRSHNSSDKERILFMCRNGATYSGLVYVLTLLLDRIDNDNQVTIPLVVGAIKAIRPQVIPTVEQYGVLYAVLNSYHESTSVYCNIGDTVQKSSIIQNYQ